LLFHANFGDQNQLIHFMKNVAMAGGFLVLASFGAGRISVDGEETSRFAEVRDRAVQGTP
jgi:putative oxidoreductase